MEQNTTENGELSGRERRRLRREAERSGGASSQSTGGGAWKVWLTLVIILAFIVGGVFALVKGNNKAPTVINLSAPVTASDWTTGGTGSTTISLVEYSDYQCPACGFYDPILRELIKNFPEIAFTYRNFPLTNLHKNAQLAAQAAEAAGKGGKYWEMHDLLFDNQKVWETKTSSEARDTFIGYATKLELDAATFSQDLDSQVIKDKIAADYQSGLDSGVNATPSFFLNGVFITNPGNYNDFVALIKSSLASSTSPRP